MSFAPRSVAAELRERVSRVREKRAGAASRAHERWRPWDESACPVPWSFAGAPRASIDLDGRAGKWRCGDLVFRADFDGGNLAKVARARDNCYHVWTRPDCDGTPHETRHRTWFHFSVEGDGARRGETVTFTIMNLNKQGKLFNNGFRPVYRTHPAMKAYERVTEPCKTHVTDDGAFKVTFKHRFEKDLTAPGEKVFFAFTYPFGAYDCEAMLDAIDARFEDPTHGEALREVITYGRETLATSLDGRKVEMITITGKEVRGGDGGGGGGGGGGGDEANENETPPEPDAPGDVAGTSVDAPGLIHRMSKTSIANFPGRNSRGKKVFVVSAGVHPGEKPGFHMMCGVVEFLLRVDDPRAAAARDAYVFNIIPCLNPDGAFRGHYRCDTLGQNLNRCYDAPDAAKQPAIHAARRLLAAHAERDELGFYVDLHGHVNKRGCFAFGNSLEGRDAVEARAWARLVALNTPHFDFNACDFSEKNARMKNGGEGGSKEGSGRVAMHRATGLPHLYVVEANYDASRLLSHVPPASNDPDGRASPPSRALRPVKYTPGTFHGVGRALVVAALDLLGRNPMSRVPASEFKSMDGLRRWASAHCRVDRGGGGRRGAREGEGEDGRVACATGVRVEIEDRRREDSNRFA